MPADRAPRSVTLLGMRWVAPEAATPGEAVALVRVAHDGFVVDEPAIGLELAYRATDERRCIGRRAGPDDDGVCGRRPAEGDRRCGACAAAEAVFAANLHHAHVRDRRLLSEDARRHLAQPNHLYLALFADGSAKIGTSTRHRTRTRWAEQGAWLAAVVGETSDGISVRHAEDRVTHELGLGQTVAVGRKLDGLVAPRSDDELRRRLEGLAEQVTDLLEVDPSIGTVTDLTHWTHPGRRHLDGRRLHRYPGRLDDGAHQLRIEAVIGRVAVVTRTHDGAGDDRFVADLGQLYGVVGEVGRHEVADIVIQDSLF